MLALKASMAHRLRHAEVGMSKESIFFCVLSSIGLFASGQENSLLQCSQVLSVRVGSEASRTFRSAAHRLRPGVSL
jgi:hypothetical protein